MQVHWWVIAGINPVPYRNPIAEIRRAPGKTKPYAQNVKDEELRRYQAAITAWGITENIPLLEPPYQIHFFWWRRLIRYQSESGRWVTKKRADQTNLQKATEDALQPSKDPQWNGMITNDVHDRYSGGLIVEEEKDTEPLIVIQIASQVPDSQRVYVPTDLLPEAADGILEAKERYAQRVAINDDNWNE
jgi:hypothetical protein